MGIWKSKPSKGFFIFAIIVLLFLAGAISLVLSNREKAADQSIPFDYSVSITPTPHPLPTQINTSSFSIVGFFNRIFGRRNPPLYPSRIEKGQQEAENTHFELYSENNYLPVDIPWWQQESQRAYDYVSTRLNATMSGKVIVTFLPSESGNCPSRGAMIFEQRPIIEIFADRATSKVQILGVFAHELGHVFLHQEYPNLSDVALDEGMATWAAGDYWKDWKGADFNSGVKGFISNGTFLPLYQNYYLSKAYDNKSTDCIAYRDTLYTEFASFLDFLLQNYGVEKLHALFNIRQPELVNNRIVTFLPNYRDVYGLEFNQLEYEWLKTLLEQGQ